MFAIQLIIGIENANIYAINYTLQPESKRCMSINNNLISNISHIFIPTFKSHLCNFRYWKSIIREIG